MLSVSAYEGESADKQTRAEWHEGVFRPVAQKTFGLKRERIRPIACCENEIRITSRT